MHLHRRAALLGGAALTIVGGPAVSRREDEFTLGDVEEAISYAAGEYDSSPCADTSAAANLLAGVAARGALGTHHPGQRRAWERAHARALVIHAHAQHHMGLPDAAKKTLRKARGPAQRCGDGPTMAHLWALAARVADREGYHETAVAWAQRGRSLAPRSALALLLTVKTEAGAWSSLARPDMVRDCVTNALAIQAAIGPAKDAPRGFSLLDDGLHPADVALSAAAALAVVGLPDEQLLTQAAEGADESGALAMRAAVRIVGARTALAYGRDDEAAALAVEAAGICPDGRDWLAREIAEIGAMVAEVPAELAEVMGRVGGPRGGESAGAASP